MFHSSSGAVHSLQLYRLLFHNCSPQCYHSRWFPWSLSFRFSIRFLSRHSVRVRVGVYVLLCDHVLHSTPREAHHGQRFNSNICHFDKNMCFCVPSLLLIANSNPLVHDEHNERTRTRERNPGVGEDVGWERWLGGWELGRKREAPVATFSPFTLKMCRKLCVFVSSVWGGPFHTLLFPLLCQWMVVLVRTNSGFGGAL